ncbi:MAG: hypothetical protein JKY27_04320 [Magnetovibrio sp.]|nr:hypothetical protein [Magnetovibrio sp.]
MKLYLVQHAKALSKEENPRRTLSQEGLNDAIKMAAFLFEAGSIACLERGEGGAWALAWMQRPNMLSEY